MFRRSVFTAWMGLLAVAGISDPVVLAAGTDASSSAATFLPDGLVGVVTLRDGQARVGEIRAWLDRQQYADSTIWQFVSKHPGVLQARMGLAGLAVAAGTDPWSGLGALLGRELAVGLAPGSGDPPRIIAVSVLGDVETAKRILGAVHILTGLDRDGEPDPARSQRIGDTVVYSANPNIHHCLIDNALLVSTDRALLGKAIDARRTGKGRLADAARYKQAARSIPADAVAWVYADVATIRDHVTGGDPLPTELPNGLAAFLVGAWWHTIAHADQATLWVTSEADALAFHARVQSSSPLSPVHRGFLPKPVPADTWSADTLPRFMAELSITRDWSGLFAHREELMSFSAVSGLAEFSGTMTQLMGQMDFVDEFLPLIAGPLRLILARQDFSKRPYKATPKLPAFALVIPLRDKPSDYLVRRLNTVTTQVLAFLNLNASQDNRPGFLIGLEDVHGYRVISAEYATGPLNAKLNLEPPGSPPARKSKEQAATGSMLYNFAPAGAVVDNRFIIATSGVLLRNIINSIHAQPVNGRQVTPSGPTTDRITISGREVQAILRDNRPELVTNRMLDTDRSANAVGREIDGFLGILDFMRRLEVTSRCGPSESTATIRLVLRKPPTSVTESK